MPTPRSAKRSRKTAETQIDLSILIDGSGNIASQTAIGGSQLEFVADALLNNNSNLIVTSSSDSGISGMKTEALRGINDVWVFELNSSELLGIEILNQISAIHFFPNPCNDLVSVVLPDEFTSGSIAIYSMDGKLLLTKDFFDSLIEMKVDELSSGKYLIKVFCNDSIFHSTIIKN